jgi:hypothetical protein
MFVVVAVVALTAVALAAGATKARGDARLHQYNQSGIQGRITFFDDGSTLTAHGTATGMNPSDFYISLLYDNRSVPGGPLACEPSASNTVTEEQMFVGVWVVDANGNGTLSSEKTGASYVPLSQFRTVSIRAESLDFDRVACGQVADNAR